MAARKHSYWTYLIPNVNALFKYLAVKFGLIKGVLTAFINSTKALR